MQYWQVRVSIFIGAIVLLLLATTAFRIKAKLRRLIIPCWVFSALLTAAAIAGGIVYDWNEYGIVRIPLYCGIYGALFVTNLMTLRLQKRVGPDDSKVSYFLAEALTVIVLGSAVATVFTLCGVSYFNQPAIWQEEHVVESLPLIAVKDAFQVEGTRFVITEKGVYRFYSQEKDGGIKQGSVDVDDTTIIYTEEGELPHLDKCEVTEKWYARRQNQDVLRTGEKETHWKLHVPADSIIETYEFNLE